MNYASSSVSDCPCKIEAVRPRLILQDSLSGIKHVPRHIPRNVFTLELDAILCFDPPMSGKGPGIPVTNTLQIPFVPFDGLSIVSRIFGEPPMPEGPQQKEVTWDADREVFMAYTEHVFCDFPILNIPQEIGFWLDLGWKFGSYADKYDPPQRGRKPKEANFGPAPEIEDDAAKQLHSMKPADRPEYFNHLLDAVVRTMAELNNNWPVAYAMDKTKIYFSETAPFNAKTPAEKKFAEAARAFGVMDFKERWNWCQRVVKRNPRLDLFLPADKMG